jgi:integration host factor subunit alpha
VSTTVKEEFSLNKKESKKIVAFYYEEVPAMLEDDDQAELSGLGNFDFLNSNQRSGSNPRTIESPITARRKLTFRSGQ